MAAQLLWMLLFVFFYPLVFNATGEDQCTRYKCTNSIMNSFSKLEYKQIQLQRNVQDYMSETTTELRATINALIRQMEARHEVEMAKFKQQLFQLDRKADLDTKGSTYVRWGRLTCPGNGSDVVYKGFVGGSNHNAGNAANYLCLPEDPQWKAYDTSKVSGSKLYGSEYQPYDVDLTKFLGQDLAQKDPVCVVCSTLRSRVLMIPGKTSCNAGWTEEYDGYLASDHVHHKASEFICIDDNAEYREGSEQNKSGHLLYLVQAKCGSLPCPPYIEGRQITCVVCSK